MKRSGPMKRASFKQKVTPESGILRTARLPEKVKTRPSLKSRQRAVIADEKVLWDRMAAHGCIACLIDGRHNTWVSIHHIDGRTKPGCHKLVLALCAEHHQQNDIDPLRRVAVHPNKGLFESRYGSQLDLLKMTLQAIGEI